MSTIENTDRKDSSVMFRSSIIAAVLLGIFLNGVIFVAGLIAGEGKEAFQQKISVGLTMFLLWLVLTSTLRSLNKVRPETDAYKFIVAGVIISLGGGILFLLFAQIIKLYLPLWPVDLSWQQLAFFGVIGLIISIISMINLKVKNQFFGNILEFLVILLVAFLFFYFMK